MVGGLGEKQGSKLAKMQNLRIFSCENLQNWKIAAQIQKMQELSPMMLRQDTAGNLRLEGYRGKLQNLHYLKSGKLAKIGGLQRGIACSDREAVYIHEM